MELAAMVFVKLLDYPAAAAAEAAVAIQVCFQSISITILTTCWPLFNAVSKHVVGTVLGVRSGGADLLL